ncbi:MAG: hypothetical protein KDK91_10735 [Gammaproteobacteria bacterium]|nr:hypothetical protein [Gammaproteobacteria bacterium]
MSTRNTTIERQRPSDSDRGYFARNLDHNRAMQLGRRAQAREIARLTRELRQRASVASRQITQRIERWMIEQARRRAVD